MNIDETKSDAAQAMCEEDGQNRREFVNGLGKWSIVVVAAVSFLRGSSAALQASCQDGLKADREPQGPAWAVSDDRNQRTANYFRRRPPGHADRTTHQDMHLDSHTDHSDKAKIY